MIFQSKVFGKAILIRHGDEQALIAEIDLLCPVCGDHTIRIAGHHLRTIQKLIEEWIQLYPALTGDPEQSTLQERTQFGGTPPADPSRN